MIQASSLTPVVNTVRLLAIDAIETAHSGHPGMPLGAAPMGVALFANHLNISPAEPDWDNRDRFVLSAGHGSMLLYALLHLFGFALPMDELKRFRQWDSQTPGHPEVGHTVGVDATTGPLGQGVAMAVGMALAETHLAARYNRDRFTIVDHHTYALVGDGCLMEGVSSEAASFAGHNKLGKLIVLYDANATTIEGNTDLAFSEDVAMRHRAYGWHVEVVRHGEDIAAISRALDKAKRVTDQPSLIIVHTVIGFASPMAGSAKTHGAPLGPEAVAKTRATLNVTDWPPFVVPDSVHALLAPRIAELNAKPKAWREQFDAYRAAYPERARSYERAMRGDDVTFDDAFWPLPHQPEATRASSGAILNALAQAMPTLIGGSADLGPSTNTVLREEDTWSPTNRAGRNIHFGVREFAMAAIANGIALHGGLRPYVSTFFVFTDYMKAAIRLSALMQTRVLYILTHDSIGVGEDGPTHQPIEQLAMLRATPGLTVFRPADGKETAAAYRTALARKGPTCLILTRQTVPLLNATSIDGAARGAYIVLDDDDADTLLIASGSEVALALDVAEALRARQWRVRVVSMPAMDLFDAQPKTYRDAVLPPSMTRRVAIEAAASQPWYRYVGLSGLVIGLDRFGASAPGPTLASHFGFTTETLVERLTSWCTS